MSAGLRAYGAVLSDRTAVGFSLAAFVARMPMAMTAIGTVLLVSTHGSFGRAGLITGVGTLTGAVAAPLWGRVIDRWGQARVLITAAVTNTFSSFLVIVSVQRGWPLAVSLVGAFGVGLGYSSAGSAVRARWSHRSAGSPLLNTAFAFEAVLDEVVFIIGPVLVTFLATAIHPALGIATSATVGLIGAVALAVQRESQPPVHPPHADRVRARLPSNILVPVAVASIALGMIFGGMEVAVVAFAGDAGVLRYTGLILMVWAVGSLIAGGVTGAVAWRSGPARRFRIGAVALALSTIPLLFLDRPVLVAGVLMISGMAIAPTMIASVGVIQNAVPASRLTESLAWSSTGLATGLAVGAAVLGQLIDLYSWRAGFVGITVAGALLIIAAQFVRDGNPASPGPSDLDPVSPDTEPARPSPRATETP